MSLSVLMVFLILYNPVRKALNRQEQGFDELA
jgi:hypothetical protein